MTTEIALRREKAAQLQQEGNSVRAIAELLGVGRSTVSDDIKAVRTEAKENSIEFRNQWIDLHTERLEEVVRVFYPSMQAGDLQSALILLKVLERQAKLLGLDAPTSTSLNVEAPRAFVKLDSKADEYIKRHLKQANPAEES